jgi:hypothetical protein
MSVQTSYSNDPAVAFAGMLSDDGFKDIVSGLCATRKLLSVAITADNNDVYTITINGIAFAYTADGSATTAEITVGLRNLINAGSEPVLASGTDTPLLIESTLDGTEGDFTYSDGVVGVGTLVETVLVAQGQEVPFGHYVCLDERATTAVGESDFSVRLPRQSADITGGRHLGLAIEDKAREENSAEFRANTMIPVLRQGRAWVECEQAVVAGDPVYVRYAAGGNGLGGFGNTAGTSERALLPNSVYLNAAAIAGFAIVEFNR